MNRIAFSTLSITLTLCGAASAQTTPQTFPVTQLTAGMYVIQAEVAATEAQREEGLMFRHALGQNQGMVFLFGSPAGVCIWMKNTLIPLSVAFIDGDHKIINIEDMQAKTLSLHCAKKPATYALEMNLHWFKQKNIKPGMVIQGLPD